MMIRICCLRSSVYLKLIEDVMTAYRIKLERPLLADTSPPFM